MKSPALIGMDLAWSDRNPSGLALAHLEDERVVLQETGYLVTDEEILEWMSERTPGEALLAIDAPIVAPNPPGTARMADRLMTQLFGRYHAGAYPANRERCARPIRLRRKLEQLGFSPDPRLPEHETGRHQIEFYPHASMVCLLRLPRIIKYKKGPVTSRRRGLRALQKAILELGCLAPPLGASPALTRWVRCSPSRRVGRELKRLEDQLDAILLAYLAAYYRRWGLERCMILGDLEQGYILTVR